MYGRAAISLRPATPSDVNFGWEIYRESMRPLTEELLSWHNERQRAVVESAFNNESTSIITFDGQDAGWMQVLDRPEHLYLSQLYVRAGLRGQGIGTMLVKQLCDRAERSGKPLKLDVMKNNRARTFYDRLGFTVTGTSTYKIGMEWRAARPE
jgi:ribosomal protein S18 acetylase RimI-like enzyme